jgi:hypothetical protein
MRVISTVLLVLCVATIVYAQAMPTRGECLNRDEAFVGEYEFITLLVVVLPIFIAFVGQWTNWWWVTSPRARWIGTAAIVYALGIVFVVFLPYLAARRILPESACWYAPPGYLDCLGMSFREDRRLLWLFPTGGRPAVLSWFAMLLGYSVTLAVALAMYLGIARMAKGTHGLKAK